MIFFTIKIKQINQWNCYLLTRYSHKNSCSHLQKRNCISVLLHCHIYLHSDDLQCKLKYQMVFTQNAKYEVKWDYTKRIGIAFTIIPVQSQQDCPLARDLRQKGWSPGIVQCETKQSELSWQLVWAERKYFMIWWNAAIIKDWRQVVPPWMFVNRVVDIVEVEIVIPV